jgi:hypothetical protein
LTDATACAAGGFATVKYTAEAASPRLTIVNKYFCIANLLEVFSVSVV